MKVLVVDDEASVREVCQRSLLSLGFEVTTAENGEVALELLDRSFDIVLTDLKMPGSVGGNELTRRVRAAGSCDVLIMTAYPDMDSAIQAVRDGAFDYLVKPVDPAGLRRAVQRCAEKRRLSKELACEKALRTELDEAHGDLSKLEKVRDLFDHFVTPEVTRLVLAHPEDFWKRGERRVVSILFADVRGFTPFAGRVTPEEAVVAVNEIFGILVEQVHSQGGMVNKFMGDGMMALFGAPVHNQAHSAAAVWAALGARQTIAKLAVSRKGQDRQPLQIGMGINTGEVMVGYLGTKERIEYSAIGHAVNVAARLEKTAQAGQILVGPETTRLLPPSFFVKECGEMKLKGVNEPIRVSSLVDGPESLITTPVEKCCAKVSVV